MERAAFSFRVTHADGGARRGILTTPHGDVETPAFMPVGTRGAVKGVTHRDLGDLGAQILLCNTYHLHLRPGDDLIARRGGLHRFIGWSGPILTDSGGYQVFSLADRCVVGEDGVRFRSHLDGSSRVLTPERATDIQVQLGSDVAMVLDECLAYPAELARARASMDRTVRWARRARNRLLQLEQGRAEGVRVITAGQGQFGIVQGGTFPDLRRESAERTVEIGFDGYAIGGLSVGEPVPVMYDIVARTTSCLPADRPRYLMGAGTPDDLVAAVAQGVDLFDCVLPTRNARNGQLFTAGGRINIKNARYAEDDQPIDADCGCYTCRQFSRAYLRHLFLAGEINAATLNTLHNLHFYLDTLRRIREAIVFGRLESLQQSILSRHSHRP
jgi:queuine tRNA-ribosyltransferase